MATEWALHAVQMGRRVTKKAIFFDGYCTSLGVTKLFVKSLVAVPYYVGIYQQNLKLNYSLLKESLQI